MTNDTKIDEHAAGQFKKFLIEFKNESDRAAVILGAAKLDILLYQLLTKFLITSPTGTDELFDGDSPLGTFSSKINLAYRLGLIDKDFSLSLHLIRKIRNSFAHEISGISLDNGGHADRVRQLCLPLREYKNFEEFRNLFLDNRKDTSTNFRIALCVSLLRLEAVIGYVRKIKTIGHSGAPLVPEAWIKAVDDSKKSDSTE
jgi:hypothetical protein